MTIDRTGRGYQLGHDGDGYRVWASGGPASAGRVFPKSPEGWQQAWKEFEWLESQLPAAPPPPARTRKPRRSRAKVVTVGTLLVVIAVAVILGVGLLGGGDGEGGGGGTVLLTEDFSEPVSGSSEIEGIHYVDGALRVTPVGGDSETTISLAACESPFIELCDAGSRALRVGADVKLVSRQGDTNAAAGIGCENRDTGNSYAFVLAAKTPPQFEVYGNDGVLATAVAPTDLQIGQPHRFVVQCRSGTEGSGTALALQVDGVEVLRATDPSKTYTVFDALDLVVMGRETVGVFDNAVIQQE